MARTINLRHSFFGLLIVILIIQTKASDTNIDEQQEIQFCVMKGTPTHEFPPTSETYSAFNVKCSTITLNQIQPVPALARRTCETFYQENACCNHQQTLAMQESLLLQTIDRNFVNCPACLSNIWGLWCGLMCSPYQGNFVNVSSTHEDEQEEVVESIDYFVNRIYAEAIYDTCRNVHMSDEGITVHDKFPVYQEFFGWMISLLDDFNVTIFYVDNEQASPPNFIGSIYNCDKSCSCNDCEEACYPPPNINVSYNNTLPTIEMFNTNWSYLTLMLCMVYLFSMLIFFFVIGLWFPCVRYVQLRSRTLPVWICLGVVLVVIALAITLSASLSDHSCTVEMFDQAWNCYTVVFVLILFGVLFITPIVLSIYYYFALKHLGRLNDQATSWQAIDHQAAPTLRKKGLLQLYFLNHGQLCARHPMKVILLSFLVTLALGAGIVYFQREVSPEGLWVDPQSRSLKDQKDYEGIFGPECRKEQLIITSDVDSVSILDYTTLSLVLSIQQDIVSISVLDSTSNISYNYSNLCLKPTPQSSCLIESALEYWQSNANTLSQMKYTIEDHIKFCTTDPNQLTSGCLNTLGDPIDPRLVLGGFTGVDYQHATALILTFFIDNTTYAEAWESKFLEIASKEYSGIKVAYNAQSSLKNELLKVSETNEVIVLVSYCVALLYIAIALGRLFPIQKKYVAVDSKFFLGVGAISIVIQSILISTGFCSYLGIKSTLFISVILPFLILAVGVDNIFVLVDTLENTDPSLQAEERISEALSHAGSSMAMASLCEALTFFLGAITEMPAVKAFAIYSGTTILVNFILQTTLFVAYLTLDLKRVEDNRIDCIPCIRVEDYNLYASDELAPLIKGVSRKKNKGVLRTFAEKYYGPFILHPIVKTLVVLSFLTLLLPGIYYATQLEVGLDQRDYLPKDNYIVNFMNKQDNVSTIGPLLWLVVKDYDYSNEDLQSEVCTLPGCNRNGLMNIFQYAPFFSNNDIPHSWINSYLEWSSSPTCCLADFSTGTPCTGDDDCEPCVSLTDNNRPLPSQFYPYIQTFLSSEIKGNSCSISGTQYYGDVIMDNPSKISASRFRYFYSPLLSQSDYINAIRVTYELIDTSQIPDAIAFSDFFIYYGQFLDIKVLALQNLMIALAGVFFITFCIMGNPSVSLCITVVVAMIEVDVLGAMQIWDLKLNPVSLVNLLMAMGISIEFCVHIGYAFTRSQGRRHDRAYRAIVEMFPVVFSGISMFKLLLVTVLGVTSGQIFKVYYFNMYCFMLVLGVTHALIFLPVFLSLVGTDAGALCLPQQYKNHLSGVIASKRVVASNTSSGNVTIQNVPNR